MATIRIVLGIICLAFSGQLFEPGSDILRFESEVGALAFDGEGLIGKTLVKKRKLQTPNSSLLTPASKLRTEILTIARSQLNVREATGKNDGVAIEKYLKYTGNKKGEPWCASFVSWVYGQAGFLKPKTAWSPALFPLVKQTNDPLPADVFGIYFPKLKRIAHCGLVELSKGNWIYTIEGNTNRAGSREGDGVYRKLRHTKTIKTYAVWFLLNKKGGGS